MEKKLYQNKNISEEICGLELYWNFNWMSIVFLYNCLQYLGRVGCGWVLLSSLTHTNIHRFTEYEKEVAEF
jgi:hypothetical protein